MHRHPFLLASAATVLGLAPAAHAGPATRAYDVTLAGTQDASWSVSETGSCEADDGSEQTLTGDGSGTGQVTFRTPHPDRVIVSRVGRSNRWAFAYQPYDVQVTETRSGTHRQTCPGSEVATFTSPTDDCGTRTATGAVQAVLNLPAARRPGYMDLTTTGGPAFPDCPYFFGLDTSQVDDELGLGFDTPDTTVLAVRKAVGGRAFRRGKPVTVAVRRARDYRTVDSSSGRTTTTATGRLSVQLSLTFTPVRKAR